ncbi:hypothetical protein Tdes44962_MAKER09423 [Teratosphaeria destructans]|uniref:Uncharacterized protein n=1 Tax=Teratosphaeria destructans TaxID=418781 RepID=A0A9W7W3A7_9PEZI|nr:hypothetical protein Tdes44962_MAKER09423 [Teratosphaeria destructans]
MALSGGVLIAAEQQRENMSLPKLPAEPLARLNTLHQILSLGRPLLSVSEERRYRASLALPPWVLHLLALDCSTSENQGMKKKVEALAKGKLTGSSHAAKLEAAKLGCEVLELLAQKQKGKGARLGGTDVGDGQARREVNGQAAVGGSADGGRDRTKREARRVVKDDTTVGKVSAKRKREDEDDDSDSGPVFTRVRPVAKRVRRIVKEESEDES